MLSVTSLTVDGVLVPESTAYGVDGWFLAGDVVRLRGTTYRITEGVGNVTLVFVAGFVLVPPDVTQAVLEMAALMYRERDRVGQQSRNTADGSTVFYYAPPGPGGQHDRDVPEGRVMAKPILSGRMVGAETIVGDIRRYGDTIRAKLRAEVQASAQELAGLAASLAPRQDGRPRSVHQVGRDRDRDEAPGERRDGHQARDGVLRPVPGVRLDAEPEADLQHAGESVAREPTGSGTPATREGGATTPGRRGSGRSYAHPFLKPALAQLRGRIRERMLAAVRG